MPLISDSDLVRIDLPAPGEYVMVKEKLSRGDRVRVQQALVGEARVVSGANSMDLSASAIMDAAEFATLDIAIKQMFLVVTKGGEPAHVEPTSANIRKLDPASVDCIKAALEELYPVELSEDECRNLSANGRRSSKAKAGHPSN